mmetsp:Transcript_20374/g.37868  ORF Transcript_20374/g.37868 Transcript_20374/m.37868 type:complete len:261 (+) Transcript_20374:126-908(+)
MSTSGSIKYRGDLGRDEESARKWIPESTDEFLGEADLSKGRQLWVVRVPADFDEDLLDGAVLPKDGKLTVTDDEGGNAFLLQLDQAESQGQLQCMLKSSNKSNGLVAADTKVAHSFSVVQLPAEEVSEDEAAEGELEEERLNKMKEVCERLTTSKRKQIEFRNCFQMFGESSRTTSALPKMTFSKRETSEFAASGKEASFEDFEDFPEKKQKKKKEKKEKKEKKAKKSSSKRSRKSSISSDTSLKSHKSHKRSRSDSGDK